MTDNTATFWNIPFDGLLDCYNMLGGATLCEAGILCFEMPAMTAQKLRFNKMEKYNVITFVYDNDCEKEQPAPLCSEDMVK